jgi:hypothetical protein
MKEPYKLKRFTSFEMNYLSYYKNYVSGYGMSKSEWKRKTEYCNISTNEKEKERRLSYFKKEILKDRDIQSISIENNRLVITYQNGQIFKCSGYFVEKIKGEIKC